MSVYKRGKVWWYKFNWNGEPVRESTKQSNKRVAEQMEAAHRTSLAKGEVGIRERKSAPSLKDFADRDFKPYIEARFQNKPKTLEYYRTGLKNLNGHGPLAGCRLDAITAERIAGFVAKRPEAGLEVSSINRQLEVLRRMFKLAMEWGKVEKALPKVEMLPGEVSSINRQLEVLRRMFKLAMEWGKVEKALPKVEMLPGENHRDRVLSASEEASYLEAANTIGQGILESYQRALEGIRATKRCEEPIRPDDPFLLRDVTTVLIDCALRPEECFRLRWEHVRDGVVHVPFGKTENARRTIPVTPRVAALLKMRRATAKGEWVFPAPTRSGHIEKSTLKKQHLRACKGNAKDDPDTGQKRYDVMPFPLYTFRHSCLTRWAEYMDPYTLAYLAGHSDFTTTRRYVHPQAETVRAAMERARNAQGGHKTGHSGQTDSGRPNESTAVIN